MFEVWSYADPESWQVGYVSFTRGRPTFARHMRAGSEASKRAWMADLFGRGLRPVLACCGSFGERAAAYECWRSTVLDLGCQGQARFNFVGQGTAQIQKELASEIEMRKSRALRAERIARGEPEPTWNAEPV